MEFALLGWPEDGHRLRLDHEHFAYAGKFVMTATGKAVVGDDGVVAAAAFDADRTDPDTLCIRYVTVRDDRRGEGIGSDLLRFVREQAADRVRAGHHRRQQSVLVPGRLQGGARVHRHRTGPGRTRTRMAGRPEQGAVSGGARRVPRA